MKKVTDSSQKVTASVAAPDRCPLGARHLVARRRLPEVGRRFHRPGHGIQGHLPPSTSVMLR